MMAAATALKDAPDSAAQKYLAARGLSLANVPDGLFAHGAVQYFDKGSEIGSFDALLCEIRTPDGKRIGVGNRAE